MVPSVGRLFAEWRKTRRLSQLALASDAAISARHLSFIETGRSTPSRDMVLRLASVLEVPLRERNTLLVAAGFAPEYVESQLDAPELAAVGNALDAILRQQEPYPAVVMNRHWDIIRANTAARRFFAHLRGDVADEDSRPNVLRMMLHPDAVRPYIANWFEVAETLVRRVHRECVGGVVDPGLRALLDEILAYPGVPDAWRKPDVGALLPFVPVSFVKAERRFDFFSTVTTLGTPQDITVQEIRIECFFPANAATAEAARAL